MKMTAETKFPVNQNDITSFSKDRQEPQWLTDLRVSSLEPAQFLELARPDKTNITKCDFDPTNIEANVQDD
ncbi:hypothetical protein, partial [Pseudomonas sp. 2822-15]|uniref:hypothetical protein n=1 Tax=Pseudomonas sp. 2822-15 TaxID=1712677 RepID=UPI001C46F621